MQEGEGEEEKEEDDSEDEEEEEEEEETVKQENEKARIDEMWASFKADIGQKPARSSGAMDTSTMKETLKARWMTCDIHSPYLAYHTVQLSHNTEIPTMQYFLSLLGAV